MILCKIGLHWWKPKERGYFKHHRVCIWCGLYQEGTWSWADNRAADMQKYTDNPRALANYWFQVNHARTKRGKELQRKRIEKIRTTIVPWEELK